MVIEPQNIMHHIVIGMRCSALKRNVLILKIILIEYCFVYFKLFYHVIHFRLLLFSC